LNANNLINSKKLSILVVEDDELSFLYLNIILNKISDNVTRAKDGKEALEIVTSKKFDVVLLDINLPVMSGIDVANKIHEMYPKLGIILNSAFSSEGENEYPSDKDNFVYLVKPLIREKVIKAIEKVLSSSGTD
jgi:two-component SAPR family response regulator